MTDLSASFRDELHRVNAKLINEISGPNNTRLQFWAVPQRDPIIVQLFPDGFEVFRPVSESNSTAALLEGLSAYLPSG